jgi:folate-binding protein YgfZ
MTSDWIAFLGSHGARLAADTVSDFGVPSEEQNAVAAGSVLADLSSLAVLAFVGENSADFLQAQLSCEVKALAQDRCVYGSYNTPKGRMLASFLLWRRDGAYDMLLSRSVLEATHKRLQMFVLRAKVRITTPEPERVVMGAAGPAAETAIDAACGSVPRTPYEVAHAGATVVVRLPSDRFLLTSDVATAKRLWPVLAEKLTPVGTQWWEWLDIVNGVPLITAATQDQFVPQMVNLERLGGVSFNKGCYPGQEIVARTQYRGKLKRRMYLARVATEAAQPGDAVFSEDLGEQAAGTIVNAAPTPDGGFDVLAVVQDESATASTVHLGSLSGPALEFRALPYATAQ